MVIYRAVPETGGPLTVKSHSKQWWLKVLYLSFFLQGLMGNWIFKKLFLVGKSCLFFNAALTLEHRIFSKIQ